MHPPRLMPSLRRAIVFGLALALWFAGTLGLVHRSVHGHAALPPVSVSGGSAAGGASCGHEAQVLDTLFSGHDDGDNQCRLYDQLSGGHALPGVPLLALQMVLAAASYHFFVGEALARWVALFNARGPPLTR